MSVYHAEQASELPAHHRDPFDRMLVAQAQAEIRRAAAVALEQENVAKVQEMQAKLVEAESQIPLAMAEAFRSGNLGVMDYYRLRNVEADTGMRESISKGVD